MTNPLGLYLKDRRARLDPQSFGFPTTRRRTPGLRREEVAQRANVSATWYTWLEQGRGGAPSADVLDRIARAMMLTDVEREHLFLIGLGRAPEVRYAPKDGVTPRLQRVLDALPQSPALLRSATWDVVAWNAAAALVLLDYATLPPHRRNLLRLLFTDPRLRASQVDWTASARFVVAAFRADVARAGAQREVAPLVEELQRIPEFAAIWAENDVRGSHFGEVVKAINHPTAGRLSLDYSAFAVQGRPDLDLIIYTPSTPQDADKIARLVQP